MTLEEHLCCVSSITKGTDPSYLFKMPLAVHHGLVGHAIVRTIVADPKSRRLFLLLFLPGTNYRVRMWSKASFPMVRLMS